MTNFHRNTLQIDLSAIRYNYETICASVKNASVMPVLKANAYGLGAPFICKTLRDASIIALADLNEALEVKNLHQEILILGDILAEELAVALEHNFIIPIGSLQKAIKINALANKKVKCHLIIDTGMGRLGIPYEKALSEIKEILRLPQIELQGIYSHFPVAYTNREFSLSQITKFKDLLTQIPHKFKYIHIANSDGIHNIPEACEAPFNLVRSGLNLYGVYDLEGEHRFTLKNSLILKSTLVRVRELEPDTSLGYGRTCVLPEKTRVGTVAIGYADGFPFNDQAYVLYRGVKCPILGRVSMDYITIDLSLAPQAQSGDEVICLSQDLPVSLWAKWKHTLTYEIICSLGNRIKRIYK